ncbi:MAG: hypothetical protein K2J80_12920 [Oscillospiraceae bacterium]|nr:hypothetical protein [Oscillospiraceae bacterium]
MGFMDFFRNLFGKKIVKVSENSAEITIDIRKHCFVINGNKLEVPIHINALSAVLGEPRAHRFKTDAAARHVLETTRGEPVTDRVNYTWDALGLMCYTHNGKVVNTFGIQTQKQTNGSPSNAKSQFKGTITINGQPWLPVIMAGKDCDVMRQVYVGEYLITAEYTDFDQDDSTRDETSFTGLEIQLK